MSSVPSIRSVWKQAAFCLTLAVVSAYAVKSNVTIRRRQQFAKEASSYDTLMQERVKDRSGESIATVKPGFPLDDGVQRYQRKSEYEGAGSSVMSRRQGDKFNWGHFWGGNK